MPQPTKLELVQNFAALGQVTKQGHVISWSPPSKTHVGALRAAMAAEGITAAERHAPDLSPESRVARVAAAVASTNARVSGSAHISRSVHARKRQITEEKHAFGPADHHSLAYEPLIAVEWRDDTKEVCYVGQPAGALAHIDATIRDQRTGADVTAAIQSIIFSAGCDLIPVREQGGAYFLPSPLGDPLVKKLSAILYSIGGRFYAFSCLLGDSATEDASLANAVTDYLLAQVGELRDRVGSLTADTKPKVKQRRATEIRALRGKLASYANLLAGHAQQITDALDETEAVLLAQMDGEPVAVAD